LTLAILTRKVALGYSSLKCATLQNCPLSCKLGSGNGGHRCELRRFRPLGIGLARQPAVSRPVWRIRQRPCSAHLPLKENVTIGVLLAPIPVMLQEHGGRKCSPTIVLLAPRCRVVAPSSQPGENDHGSPGAEHNEPVLYVDMDPLMVTCFQPF
jgi:hypothetical protein